MAKKALTSGYNEFKLKSFSRYTKSEVISKLLQRNGNLSERNNEKINSDFRENKKFVKLFIVHFEHLSSLCKDPDEWNSDTNFLVKSHCDVS